MLLGDVPRAREELSEVQVLHYRHLAQHLALEEPQQTAVHMLPVLDTADVVEHRRGLGERSGELDLFYELDSF